MDAECSRSEARPLWDASVHEAEEVNTFTELVVAARQSADKGVSLLSAYLQNQPCGVRMRSFEGSDEQLSFLLEHEEGEWAYLRTSVC